MERQTPSSAEVTNPGRARPGLPHRRSGSILLFYAVSSAARTEPRSNLIIP